MKIGNIKQQGDITTRQGNDPSNPETPNGESFNITVGNSSTASGGSINFTLSTGATSEDNGTFNLKISNGLTNPVFKIYDNSSTYSANITSSSSMTGDIIFVFPNTSGNNGEFLSTSGSGVSSWRNIIIDDVISLQDELDLKLNLSETVTSPVPNKILYLNSNGDLPTNITGNSATATSLQTARNISLSTDATGTASFNGTANITIPLILANTGISAGSYTKVTVDTKGRVTAGLNRTITGTANQITLVNGDQQSGNPTISITSNPIIPGNSFMLVPKGTTAQRPGSPITGQMRFNTDTGLLEVYENVWNSYVPRSTPYIKNFYTGQVSPTSNTTTIDISVTPVSTGGTSIWSQTVTPFSASSRFILQFSGPVNVNTDGRSVTFLLFRGTTFITANSTYFESPPLLGTRNPSTGMIYFVDSPNTVSSITYSMRVGITGGAGTWYLGTSGSGTYDYGGSNSMSWSITEL